MRHNAVALGRLEVALSYPMCNSTQGTTVDAFSLDVLGTAGLTAALEFLYTQAGGIVRRQWARHRGEEVPDLVEPTPADRDLLAGALKPLELNDDAVQRLESEIGDLRRALADYADGTYPVETTNRDLLVTVDALRRALEAVYGQRITFAGEKRPVSGLAVEGSVDVDEIHGYVAGIRGRIIEGALLGSVRAKTVGAHGTAIGVDLAP